MFPPLLDSDLFILICAYRTGQAKINFIDRVSNQLIEDLFFGSTDNLAYPNGQDVIYLGQTYCDFRAHITVIGNFFENMSWKGAATLV